MQESLQDGTDGENQPEASEAPEQEEFGGDTIIVRPPNIADESSSNTVSQTHLRRSERNRIQVNHISKIPWRAMLATADEPETLQEALGSDERELWREAWESEVDYLMRNETWVLTQLPLGREAIGCRWLFKRKEDGHYKARLVAKGYSQKAGVDYTETFAPVAKFNSLRSLLALVSENNWELEGMDVKTAFLHSELEEIVFMHIPEGLHAEAVITCSEPPLVCQPKKSI